MKFPPTTEQQEALRLSETGDSMKIEAGAGTGKTSTLVMIAESAVARGLRVQYVAFNRPIVEEAKTKFPAGVKCSTAHQLAFAVHGHAHMPRIKTSGRMKSADVAAFLGLKGMAVDVAGERKWLSPSKLAGLVLRGVVKFCQTADEAPGAEHVPFVTGIDVPPMSNGRRNYANNNRVAAYLAPFLAKAWADIRKTDGKLPSGHHVYLKLWQLDSPRLGSDVILFDEAQDASPVMVDVVSKQTQAQVVWVGDSQQEIYSFTGAVNALATIATPHRTFLTMSFRFGPAIAQQANQILSLIPGAELRLSGHDPIPSTVGYVGEPDAVLCRTNAEAVRVVLETQKAGRTPHLVGNGEEIVSFARGAHDLMTQEWTTHPDLSCFKAWAEVIEYVEQDEQGGDLRLQVKLVEEFGVDTILAALATPVREQDADVTVSTAHKSKGREWNTVKLAGDFPEDREKAGVEELRLLYVAATRSRLELDITLVRCLDQAPLAAQEAQDAPQATETTLDTSGATDGALTVSEALLRVLDDIRALGVDLDADHADAIEAARAIIARAA